MAMTLRTDESQDAAIERLAERWQVSKTEAILRAVLEADSRRRLEDDAMDAYARVSERYRDALDRLGSV